MLGLNLLDIGVIFFYFVVLMIIGIWSSRAVKNTGDFLSRLVAGVVTGLITKPQSKEMLDKFYTELNTPVDLEEHLATDLSERK